MTEFLRPKVIISKRLGFEACRFNGEVLRCNFVPKPEGLVNFLPVRAGLLAVEDSGTGWR